MFLRQWILRGLFREGQSGVRVESRNLRLKSGNRELQVLVVADEVND